MPDSGEKSLKTESIRGIVAWEIHLLLMHELLLFLREI
jgi:hypothetical protein